MSMLLIMNNKEEYIYIPNEAIRVRVIANSNSEYDKRIKEKIKDELNNVVDYLTKNINNIVDIRKIINSNLNYIHNYVEKRLEEFNYNKNFTLNYGLNYFPDKIFKGIKYSDGLYESLVLTLGEGKGPNYWCVLYPPLCALDNKEEVEYRSIIKDIIDKYL